MFGTKQGSNRCLAISPPYGFFDKRRHLAGLGKKTCVTAHKFNSFRSSPLLHKSLTVRVDHSVLGGNYSVARLLFPSGHRSLAANASLETGTWDIAKKRATRSGTSEAKIACKRIQVDW